MDSDLLENNGTSCSDFPNNSKYGEGTMDIEEQIEVISTGSALYTSIERLLDLISDADMRLFVNAEVLVKSFLQPELEDARWKLGKDISEAKERLKNGVES